MMARSKCSNQRPDTLMQDRLLPARRNHLQRTAGPYIWVKLRRTQDEQMSSGLPLIADIAPIQSACLKGAKERNSDSTSFTSDLPQEADCQKKRFEEYRAGWQAESSLSPCA